MSNKTPRGGVDFGFIDCCLSDYLYRLEQGEILGGCYNLKYLEKQIKAVRKADNPARHVVPAGWKLVPVEPTTGMKAAADSEFESSFFISGAWEAVLSAAPEPSK